VGKKNYKWRFGEILVQNGWITWEQLEKALEIQKENEAEMREVLASQGFINKKSLQVLHLGEILIKHKWLNWDQLSECLHIQQESGGVIGKILLAKRYITEKNLYHALAIQYDRTFVDLDKVQIDPQVIQKIPKPLAKEFGFMPLLFKTPYLFIAVSDPLDTRAETEVQKIFQGSEVRSGISGPADIRKALDRYYGADS
jgi:type IV pilus assembly protein PilB